MHTLATVKTRSADINVVPDRTLPEDSPPQAVAFRYTQDEHIRCQDEHKLPGTFVSVALAGSDYQAATGAMNHS